MKAVTEPEKWFRIGWPNSANDNRFEGSVSGNGFHVRRIIGYRNSFLPVVDGTIQAGASGTRIHVQMRMFIFVYAFCAIWAAGALAATTAGGAIGPLITLALLFFLWAMTMIGFWLEAGKQERTLRAIFKAT